jgi:hypothetical protein
MKLLIPVVAIDILFEGLSKFIHFFCDFDGPGFFLELAPSQTNPEEVWIFRFGLRNLGKDISAAVFVSSVLRGEVTNNELHFLVFWNR